ncbi:flagellin [Sphingomonas endophytica]|uniref:Flagellar hook-associated protein 3 FlgL n=1 Tax=Sphingomonas endophytica TaxID=869719 RepID=A0ABR6N4F7_9SPHN|nr:flagellin [Sphingomonas endophytica]MBB5725660.1 flagellar hook-associated protein 3 FlgL [Sphingomonas endophytica]
MTRVATMATQGTLVAALGRAQSSIVDANVQLSTAKRVQNYAALGDDTRRVLSASTMLAEQKAQGAVANRVQTTLSFYDSALNVMDSTATDLKTKLLKAVGDGNGSAVNQIVSESFAAIAGALNTSEAGTPIFAGSQTDGNPFRPATLSDVAALASPADAFANDDRRASARLENGVDMRYGITADEVGTDLVKAFQTLAGLGSFSKQMTKAQVDGLNAAMSQLDDGIVAVRTANGQNGDRQNLVDSIVKRSDDRIGVLMGVIGDGVDANLGQVAADLSTRQTILNASYSAFAHLNDLSLVNFLRS